MKQRSHSTPNTEALLGLPLFSDCPTDDLLGLLEHAELVTLPAATIVERAGTPVRQFIGIVDGHLHGDDTMGRSFVLGPGDHIGAEELFNDESHGATYTDIDGSDDRRSLRPDVPRGPHDPSPASSRCGVAPRRSDAELAFAVAG